MRSIFRTAITAALSVMLLTSALTSCTFKIADYILPTEISSSGDIVNIESYEDRRAAGSDEADNDEGNSDLFLRLTSLFSLSSDDKKAAVGLLDTDALYKYAGLTVYSSSDYNSFKLGNKLYSEGLSIEACKYLGERKPSFALLETDGNYGKMSFDVGFMDGDYGKSTLKIYLDGEPAYEYELSYDIPSYSLEFDLDHADSVKIEVLTERNNQKMTFGFANIMLYP